MRKYGRQPPQAGPRKQADDDYDHCYSLNEALNATLRWSLLDNNETLRMAFTASVPNDETAYVAFGFRPMGRFPEFAWSVRPDKVAQHPDATPPAGSKSLAPA
jgi:hypothetical protein